MDTCAGLGEDLLTLTVHPLQDMLHKADRRKFIERAFINVVNEVGVDINLAADRQLIHGNTVQFVAGLGPRKARELLRIISKALFVEHRAALLEDQEIRNTMKEVVWYNCAAFFKITKETSMWTKNYKIGQSWNEDNQEGEYVWYAGGPLEATRIHPESYQYGQQMVADAFGNQAIDLAFLERVCGPDADLQEKLREQVEELDLDAYGAMLNSERSVQRTITLKDIREELLSPFEEKRMLPSSGIMPWELNKQQEFNLLCGESMRKRGHEEISTLIDQIVHVKVNRVIRPMPKEGEEHRGPPMPYKILCKLENGLTGVLMEQSFADTDEEKQQFQMSIREDMTISWYLCK